MRFSIQDIPKTVRRHGDTLSLSLRFLRPGELQAEIAHLIAFHEQHLAQPQRLFMLDDARACIGDYRLAHALLATLSNWYRWQARSWDTVLQAYDKSGQAQKQLHEADIHSPTQLRLALYTTINESQHGFLSTQMRTETLERIAHSYQLERATLEYLLTLDSEDEALLARTSAHAPDPHEIRTLYNQWAFEAALFSASHVQFVIDYAAFARLSTPDNAQTIGSGIGSVIKRLCYLARTLGVYYDLAYQDAGGGESHLLLTLYGPQEVTGRAQQYGLRLARLSRYLLGYGIPAQASHAKTHKSLPLSPAIVSAQATVHMLQRAYTFVITPAILHLLHIAPISSAQATENNPTDSTPTAVETNNTASTLFDSSIEQHFAEAFTALTVNQHLHGWHLEREPEPLLLSHGIFIPDFALTRAKQHIYVEILGFWTATYRERKLQKLQQLQTRRDIVLALPREAAAAFASLAPHFPLILYDEQLSITDLLQVLQHHYDDFAERMTTLDSATIRRQVEREGLLSEQRCYELLHCYRRAEIQHAAEQITNTEITFTPGIGLYHQRWLQDTHQHLTRWLQQQMTITSSTTLPLTAVIQSMREMQAILMNCEESVLEGLLATWADIQIVHTSIFEAHVALSSPEKSSPLATIAEQVLISPPVQDQYDTMTHPPHSSLRLVKERRPASKKRIRDPIEQEALWDNS